MGNFWSWTWTLTFQLIWASLQSCAINRWAYIALKNIDLLKKKNVSYEENQGKRKDLRQECCFLRGLKPSTLFPIVLLANVTMKRVFLSIFPSGCLSALFLLCRLFLCWLPRLSILEITSRPIGQAENCCFICLVSQLFRHLQFLSITQFYWNLLLWSASQNKDFTKKIINCCLILFAW